MAFYGAAKRVCALVRRNSSYYCSASENVNLIKQLRERTSAPMKDVKAALVDSNWDIEAAQKELRKRGKVLASKNPQEPPPKVCSPSPKPPPRSLSSNSTAKPILLLETTFSNTWFVASYSYYLNAINSIIRTFLTYSLLQSTGIMFSEQSFVALFFFFCLSYWTSIFGGYDLLTDTTLNLEHPKISGETTVQNAITEVAAMMGENVRLRRGYVLPTASNGFISSYLHTSPQPGLGRIAGILSLEVDDGKTQVEALQRVGSELAMHVVAAKPLFLTKELVPSDALANEREILKSQAESSGKSQMAIEKMVEGRLRKYFEDVVLMDQKFIMNDTMNVKAVLDNLSKEVGSSVRVVNFLRMEVGEGIASQETDASETVAQVA
ncbi:hypothetical protein ACSQ67_009490 [Phaseolus vulgaris]